MIETAPNTTGFDFEQLYTGLRKKEGRIYSDEELLYLPEIDQDHPLYDEWQIRKESYQRIKKYIEKNISPMKILEVGCGNGWLSHRLSSISGAEVTGIDINALEITQAQRVFSHHSHLNFLNSGIDTIRNHQFDLVVFAASIHYFPSLDTIIEMALTKLKRTGEIHILDTPFYKPVELADAKKRSLEHFSQLEFPEMSGYYFHHTINELRSFDPELLYQPSFFQKQIKNNKNPFPWFRIKNQ